MYRKCRFDGMSRQQYAHTCKDADRQSNVIYSRGTRQAGVAGKHKSTKKQRK
jgi:hypothetical protein